MKKKLLALLLTVALATMMTACGDNSSSKEDDNIKADTDVKVDTDVDVKVDTDVDVKVDTDVDVDTDSDMSVVTRPDVEFYPVTYGSISFDVPYCFEDINNSGYYGHEDASVAANINVTQVASDGSFSLVTKELLFDTMDSALDAGFGTDIELQMPEYEEIVIDGHDAVKYAIEYEYMGVTLIQTQYMIDDGDYYRYITYTYTEGDGFEEMMKASAETIRMD